MHRHASPSRLVALFLVTAGLATACSAESGDAATDEAALTAATRAACLNPPTRDCSFYTRCLETTKACGADGYALGYGDKYCSRFLANDGFSREGVVWRDAVMVCLQRHLSRYLAPEDRATCEEITDGAFDDHPSCYTAPGEGAPSICDLPPSDWLAVVDTIDAEDLISSRGRRQIEATARACISQWVNPFLGTRQPHPQSRVIAEALATDPYLPARALVDLSR